MPRIHPKGWEDGVAPLSMFTPEQRSRIEAAVNEPEPPPRWLYFAGGAAMESRAWFEWHWARGKKLRRVPSPDRRRKIPDALRSAVYERDGHACLHCGATDQLSLDHIHPWSLGGTDTYDNLQTLCRPCNSRKGDRTDAQNSRRQARLLDR